MKKNQISITAQGIALMRAMEFERPEAERICSDPLAGKFIDPLFFRLGKMLAGFAERRSPGVVGFMTARCRYMDDCLRESLNEGLEQLVILGAGLDSRAYRFEELQDGVRVFEVDRPATQNAKIERVKTVLGRTPNHVTYVPIDFNMESLQKLASAGYAAKRKTLFLWEGVTMYLTAEAVDATLDFIAHNSAAGGTIVFDYIYTEALAAREKRGEIERMERARWVTGERLTFGIKQGRIGEFLHVRGFDNVTDETAEDLHRKYFTGPNRSRPVAPIYAIARAKTAGKG